MRFVRKQKNKLIILLIAIAASFSAVTTTWAALTLFDSQTDSEVISSKTEDANEVNLSAAKPSRTRAPEPSTLVLFGGGFFGMVISLIRKTYALAKRAFDIVLSVIGVILLSPLFLFAIILIKVTSKGPVVFTQTRLGKDGKSFKIFKFRTMRVDAEKETGPIWASENDPRLIPSGKFLRKAHIDEIPQFFNVLMGDMSVIGPRPERPEFVEKLKGQIPEYERRLEIKPGITGLAQVWHRYDETIEDVKKKIKYDILYIKKVCLWTDLLILLRTFRVVFTGEGAR